MRLDETTEATRLHLLRNFGSDPVLTRPRGYAHLGLAVIDSVFSLTVRYQAVVNVFNGHCRGIPRLCEHEDRYLGAEMTLGFKEYTASDLSARCADLDGVALADAEFNGNRNRTPGERTYKADAVKEAARSLSSKARIETRRELLVALADPESRATVYSAWTQVGGLADASWRYLLSLSGANEIKPDRMIIRFVQKARREAGLDRKPVPARLAGDALTGAGRLLYGEHLDLRALDHTVWRLQSGRDVMDDDLR